MIMDINEKAGPNVLDLGLDKDVCERDAEVDPKV
jgi:hypothetical protein